MKKRCTNPSCRKEFTENTVCPYCGKRYPRAARPAVQKKKVKTEKKIPQPEKSGYAVVLESTGYSKYRVLRAVRELLGTDKRGYRQCRLLVDDLPIVIGKVPELLEAQRWMAAVEAAGGYANVVPFKYLKGSDVFVYPR